MRKYKTDLFTLIEIQKVSEGPVLTELQNCQNKD